MKSKPRLKKIKSINTILWLSFTTFVVVVIALISFVCYSILGGEFFSQAKRRVQSVGDDIVREISAFPGTESNAELSGLIWRYVRSDGVNAYLFDSDGNVVVPDNFTEEDFSGTYAEVVNRLGSVSSGKHVVYNSSETFCYAAKVTYNGGEHYLLVRYPLSNTLKAVHNLRIYVVIIAGVAILAAFIISYIIAQKLSRPIKNLSVTANQLAKGDYSVQFASAEYAEIAQLSDTLNYAKEEIKKSDDFQKELLANVSHDLKTPLTMIKAYASMVKEISGNDPRKRDKHLQVIIDESDRLTGLVNDVLNASKISAGLSELNKKVFNLTEFLYGIMNKFDYLQETQGYKIFIDIDPNLYTVADEEKIGQVIYNLLSNAVNYTGSDKTVYVTLKDCPEQNRIKFSVRDTGKGISEEEKEHIWDRYYRSKDAHARPVKGTGLGLNIVKIILQAHAFDFGVTSETGKGSTFYVDFPAVSSTPQE